MIEADLAGWVEHERRPDLAPGHEVQRGWRNPYNRIVHAAETRVAPHYRAFAAKPASPQALTDDRDALPTRPVFSFAESPPAHRLDSQKRHQRWSDRGALELFRVTAFGQSEIGKTERAKVHTVRLFFPGKIVQ